MAGRRTLTRFPKYKQLYNTEHQTDIGFVVFTGLISLVLICSSIALLSMSVVNHELTRDYWKCSMENCVNKASYCGVNTCSPTGECITLGRIDGCCEPGENCTAQQSTANYAFNTICFSEIGPCQPALSQNSISSYIIQQSTEENVLNINGDVSISDSAYINGIANVTTYNFDSWLEEDNTFSLVNTDSSVPIVLKKLGDFVIYYFDIWNATVTNDLLFTQNGTISSDLLPHNSSDASFPIFLNYNGNELPGMIQFNAYGSLKWYWRNSTSGLFEDTFNCNCTFYSIYIQYFS
jgi:hypothetical protein